MTKEYAPNEGTRKNSQKKKRQEIRKLSDEFKVVIIKMLNELGRRVDEYNEKFNKELKNIKKNQS